MVATYSRDDLRAGRADWIADPAVPQAQHLDLWALASKRQRSEDEMRALALAHFPLRGPGTADA